MLTRNNLLAGTAALVALALFGPAGAQTPIKIGELVVAVIVPDDDLAAGQPHMRKIARRIDGRFVAAVEAVHVGVEHRYRFLQRIAHLLPFL